MLFLITWVCIHTQDRLLRQQQKDSVTKKIKKEDAPKHDFRFNLPLTRSIISILRYGSGSGSGSFYHQAKIVRKTLIPTVLWLLSEFIYLKNDVNVASKSDNQKNVGKIFFVPSWRSPTKIARSGAGPGTVRYGSADPDPYQNVTDRQHGLLGI